MGPGWEPDPGWESIAARVQDSKWKTLLAHVSPWKRCPSKLFVVGVDCDPTGQIAESPRFLDSFRGLGIPVLCVCSCAFTNYLLCFQLAYCVVQFMEKDATVTEYVRFLQCLINVQLCCRILTPVDSY